MRSLPLAAAFLLSTPCLADIIEQEGTLSGPAGDPVAHEIELDQFDTMGGTRELNFVLIEFLTSTAGGGQATGSGTPVHLNSVLSADYMLDGAGLAETEAVIDFVHPNTSPSAFSLFNTDTADVMFEAPGDLAPWIGNGQITMDAVTQFNVWADPPDVIDFSAGGTVRYTVTYDYSPVAPIPGDVDQDGVVDFGDVLIILTSWGPCADCGACLADVDGNCVVDFADLLAALTNWTI